MGSSNWNSHIHDAARWFAASRRGVMTLEERAAFELWMKTPANAAAIDELRRTWDTLEKLRPKVSQTSAPKAKPRRPARAIMLAVACVASLGIGVLSYDNDAQFWTTLDWSNR